MRRLTPILLVLAWLLLAASQYPCFTMSVQPVESVHLRLTQGQPSSRSHNGDSSPSRSNDQKQVKGKKIHKTSSGPNPVGNHRPPFRHK